MFFVNNIFPQITRHYLDIDFFIERDKRDGGFFDLAHTNTITRRGGAVGWDREFSGFGLHVVVSR